MTQKICAVHKYLASKAVVNYVLITNLGVYQNKTH